MYKRDIPVVFWCSNLSNLITFEGFCKLIFDVILDLQCVCYCFKFTLNIFFGDFVGDFDFLILLSFWNILTRLSNL